MPPQLALLLWAIFAIGVFVTEKKRRPRTSWALWIPAIWLLIVASREPSGWFGGDSSNSSRAFNAYMSGNPFDRNIYLGLTVLGVLVLCQRKVEWAGFIKRNRVIFIFLVYCALSILWSDHPFISLKRWVKSMGQVVAILIVLTEQNPIEGLRVVMRRVAVVLAPLSVVLIKYYPHLAVKYDPWTGWREIVGVTTSKNMLGNMAMVTSIFLIGEILSVWRERKRVPIDWRGLSVSVFVLTILVWLFKQAQSATAFSCTILAGIIIFGLGLPFIRRNVRVAVACSLLFIFVCLIFEMLFGVSSKLVELMGRDPTLTGRTEVWESLLNRDNNVLFGVGYESFWLGDRMAEMWEKHWWRPNQAHNGYIEMYIQLGVVGGLLFVGILFSGIRNALNLLPRHFDHASVCFASLIVAVLYNMTEAACRGLHTVSFLTFVCAISVPGLYHGYATTPRRVPSVPRGRFTRSRRPRRQSQARGRESHRNELLPVDNAEQQGQ